MDAEEEGMQELCNDAPIIYLLYDCGYSERPIVSKLAYA